MATMDPDSLDHDETDAVAPLPWFGPPTRRSSSSSPRPTGVARQDFQRLASNLSRQTTSDGSEHSHSRRYAASPLDEIPPNLYTSFPRFSTTTEHSSPDLSAEEMTSTRLSLDEHAIIETPTSTVGHSGSGGKRQWLQTALHRTISTPSLSLRRMKDKLRRTPSSTLSGNTLRQDTTPVSEQQSQSNVDQISGTDGNSQSNSAKASPQKSLKEVRVLGLNGSFNETFTGRSSRLSTLREAKLDQEAPQFHAQERPLLDGLTRHPQPLSFKALKAFDDLMDAPVRPVRSYHTAPDHFSTRAPSSLSCPAFDVQDTIQSRATSSRRIVSGSIDELRSHALQAATQRAYSFSGSPIGRSSQLNVDQAPRLAPIGRPITVSDVDDLRSLNQLRREPLFVDAPHGVRTNIIFPPSVEQSIGPTVPRRLRSIKSNSYRNLRQTPTLPLVIRSASIKHGLEHTKDQQKVPCYTPSPAFVPKAPSFPRRVSSLAYREPALESRDSINNAASGESEASSRRQSRASEWSINEDRAYFEEGEHPSLRSSNPSVKSVDLGLWWKGQRILAGLKKVVPHRATVEVITGSEVPLGAGTENENCKMTFKSTCGSYARRTKQKLWGSHSEDGTES